jgi:hypothetical protein
MTKVYHDGDLIYGRYDREKNNMFKTARSRLEREARVCPLNNLSCQWEFCQWFIRVGSRRSDMAGDCAINILAHALMRMVVELEDLKIELKSLREWGVKTFVKEEV